MNLFLSGRVITGHSSSHPEGVSDVEGKILPGYKQDLRFGIRFVLMNVHLLPFPFPKYVYRSHLFTQYCKGVHFFVNILFHSTPFPQIVTLLKQTNKQLVSG